MNQNQFNNMLRAAIAEGLITPGFVNPATEDLDMDGHVVTGLGDPQDPTDATPWGFVDGAFLPLSGGPTNPMQGDIDMDGHNIEGLASAVNDDDATTKADVVALIAALATATPIFYARYTPTGIAAAATRYFPLTADLGGNATESLVSHPGYGGQIQGIALFIDASNGSTGNVTVKLRAAGADIATTVLAIAGQFPVVWNNCNTGLPITPAAGAQLSIAVVNNTDAAITVYAARILGGP